MYRNLTKLNYDLLNQKDNLIKKSKFDPTSLKIDP